ncbi:phospholipase A2 inhibitor-like isoform X2 [Varroa destructor]|uniref:Uncharacterized protein n=1 Tax=Varroa destructor TaxID=109461 RepID=A0A7M7JG01_VARDE|nr:phospholipase A2 inhibitor-like isoform X2 [Varroa destructor]
MTRMSPQGICILSCLLLISCAGSAELLSSDRKTTGNPSVNDRLDICMKCTCLNKQITCNSDLKLSDVLLLQAPRDYNVLDLSTQQLTTIHEESFVEGVDITQINLAYNHISYIAPFAFRAFKNLTSITLAYNNLVTLEDDSFAYLPRLEELDLSVNRFKHFHPEYFAKLSNLRYLILDQNHLDSLHSSVFRNNTKLTHLHMNKLYIDRLDDNLFQYTKDIQVLHLGNNFFETVPYRALSKLLRLEVLTLSGNPIHYLGPASFPYLPNLQQLILHDMSSLHRIEVYSFSDLPMLRNLKIQNCKNLLYIDPKAFILKMQNNPVKYPKIRNLVIYDTQITTLSKDLLNWDDIDDLDLGKNQFHCNCNFTWIIEVVRKQEVNNRIRCSSPPAFAGHIIGELQASEVPCDNFDPLANDPRLREHRLSAKTIATHRGFSLLHLVVVVMSAVTVVLSILLLLSLRNRGFLYRKLGKPQPMTYAGGENVLYMRTTIDNY